VVHYFELIRTPDLDAASAQAFALVDLTIDGRPRAVRRTTRLGAQIYTASIGGEATTADKAVTVAFTYRALVQQNGHLFHLDFSRRTKDVRVHFAYGGCGIRHVNVLDYIASSRDASPSRLPAAGPTPSIALRFDSWVLPKAGIGFVWVLDLEMASAEARRQPARTPRAPG
jgi:hypothetical protein